jgi:hypothetical protein
MGLLREAARPTPPQARLFLTCPSPRNLHILRHHHHLVESFARMDESVRSGRANRLGVGEGETAREDFLLGMFNLAMGIAPGLARQLDALLKEAGLPGMAGRRRLLDLGGGPGTYAIQFCLAHPGRRPICPRPSPLPRPRWPGSAFGSHRLPAGDYTTDQLPGGFDLAWLSQILHGEDPATAAAVVRRAADALAPGGVLLVHEFLLNDAQDDTQDGPEFAALFSLNMLLGTPGGQAYSGGEVRGMLEAAGLVKVCRLGFTGPNDSGLIAGVKPGIQAGAARSARGWSGAASRPRP